MKRSERIRRRVMLTNAMCAPSSETCREARRPACSRSVISWRHAQWSARLRFGIDAADAAGTIVYTLQACGERHPLVFRRLSVLNIRSASRLSTTQAGRSIGKRNLPVRFPPLRRSADGRSDLSSPASQLGILMQGTPWRFRRSHMESALSPKARTLKTVRELTVAITIR
jgi:hypothetical protein